ncbi:hypothetical protein LXL04_028574 [Taraxacum kok-saghyz]
MEAETVVVVAFPSGGEAKTVVVVALQSGGETEIEAAIKASVDILSTLTEVVQSFPRMLTMLGTQLPSESRRQMTVLQMDDPPYVAQLDNYNFFWRSHTTKWEMTPRLLEAGVLAWTNCAGAQMVCAAAHMVSAKECGFIQGYPVPKSQISVEGEQLTLYLLIDFRYVSSHVRGAATINKPRSEDIPPLLLLHKLRDVTPPNQMAETFEGGTSCGDGHEYGGGGEYGQGMGGMVRSRNEWLGSEHIGSEVMFGLSGFAKQFREMLVRKTVSEDVGSQDSFGRCCEPGSCLKPCELRN